MDYARIKILIVEDDLVITHDLCELLEENGFSRIAVANNAMKAIDKLAGGDIELALLDINLGSGQSGINVADVIKRKYEIPFIFLTSYSDKATLSAAFAHQPNGYLVKPYQPQTLMSTIYLALATTKASDEYDLSKFDVKVTKKEMEIIKHLVNGFSYSKIADQDNISLNTVRYHVKNIYLKFNVNSNTELISKLIKR